MQQHLRMSAGVLTAVFGSLILFPASAHAELLINGNLDLPGLHEQDLATGWTLVEGPAANTATFATFANHTPAGAVGLWYRAFEGETVNDPRPRVNADLTQSVPGVPGLIYTMTGWARFEAGWPGGFDTLPSGGTGNSRWPEDTPSPTRTEFALEFLDATNQVLAGSVVMDLHDDLGQTNDNEWRQHTLMAAAPAGTVLVQVRASMIDGVNSDLNPQSAFVDDFSLTVIPEPASLGLCALGAGVLLARRRRN